MSHSLPPLANESRTQRRCPRCGARLGALGSADGADAPSLYCGCCGLVVPAPSASGDADADVPR